MTLGDSMYLQLLLKYMLCWFKWLLLQAFQERILKVSGCSGPFSFTCTLTSLYFVMSLIGMRVIGPA